MIEADEEVQKDRKIFNVVLSFHVPMEGVVPVAAETVEEARAITVKMFEKRDNLVIVDIYDIKELGEMSPEDLEEIGSRTIN